MIKRFFGKQKVSYMQSFEMGTDEKSFCTQFYGEGACDHQKIVADDNHCGSCLGDYEPTKEWLQCPYVRFGSIAIVSLIDNGRWN